MQRSIREKALRARNLATAEKCDGGQFIRSPGSQLPDVIQVSMFSFFFFLLLFLKAKRKIHRQEIYILSKWNVNVMKLIVWKERRERNISKSFRYISYFWKPGQNYPSTRVPKFYPRPSSTLCICTLLFFQ